MFPKQGQSGQRQARTVEEIIHGVPQAQQAPDTNPVSSDQVQQLIANTKVLQQQLAAKDNQISQLSGQVTQLAEISNRLPPVGAPQAPAEVELSPDQLNDMEPSDILAYASKIHDAKLAVMDERYQSQFTDLQNNSNSQYGNLELTRVLAANPEYKEWIPELKDAVSKGMFGKMSTEQMFKSLQAMNPDKAKTVNEKYANAGDTSNFGTGMSPSSSNDSNYLELNEYDPNVDPIEQVMADVKRYEQATGNNLNDIMSE